MEVHTSMLALRERFAMGSLRMSAERMCGARYSCSSTSSNAKVSHLPLNASSLRDSGVASASTPMRALTYGVSCKDAKNPQLHCVDRSMQFQLSSNADVHERMSMEERQIVH